MTLSGGVVYEGEIMNSFKHGFGIQKWPNGSRYEG